MAETSLYEELGGEPVLRGIIDRFVDRVFDDGMIGFFFARANRRRIKDKEFEHAAAHLGADVRYTGRPLREAHSTHEIFGGQFQRRLTILAEVLDEYGVQPHIRDHWLSHDESLRPEVTRYAGSECDPGALRGVPGSGDRS